MLQRLASETGRMIRLVIVFVLLSSPFALSQSQAQGKSPAISETDTQPWMDTSLPAEQRARLLLAAMTLDEKIAMIHGGSAGSGGYVGHVPSIPRLGIPGLNLQDGPAGVAGGALSVTAFPAPISIAASWDTALMEQYGVVMAEEERGKGANIQLGPMMNIDRVPQAGRNFEGYGEDPYLSAQMAAAGVRGIQGTGVIATAKHFIDNDQEIERTTISSEIDVRTQHEIYLPPFKASVDAGVGAIMCSYNLVNGIYACENPDTQNTILKGELGFSGWIMSDWGATHSITESALGGLDMEMPGGVHYVQLKSAIDAGQVPQSRLDDMVLRILTPMFRFGLFDRGPTGTYGAVVQTDAHKKFAREAAAQGMVLLKNDENVLPLDPARVHAIAVFGAAADEEPVIVGGGSGRVAPPYTISPLKGITDRAGSAFTVRYFTANNAVGHPIPADYFRAPDGAAGLQAQYFNSPDLSGNPVLTKVDANIDFDWQGAAPTAGVKPSNWSVRWSGVFTPALSGRYNLALTSSAGSRLYIDDKLVVDNWGEHPDQTKLARRRFTAGQAHDIRVEYSQVGAKGGIHLTWFTPQDDPNQEAAAIAGKSDAAIVVLGIASGEGVDRQDLNLSDQALITAVSRANPHTIVVVYNPAQVLLPWADQVPAILVGWLPGQEAGNALADVLFGDVNPAGKLPMTFARNATDYPANTPEMYPGVDGRVLYSEGLRVGYRHFDSRKITPLYAFGHGLSYTTFEYSNLSISPATTATDGSVTVAVDVKNTGQHAGSEVAQLYLGFPSETSEPPRQLKGFQKISLQPGETKSVTFTLSPEAFSFWSAGLEAWVAYPGTYQVMVGASSRDIRQSGTFDVQAGPLAGVITQAEMATLAGGAAVAAEQAGYTGTGFVNGFQKEGAAAAFKLNVAEAGRYNLTLRYASTLRPGKQNTPRTLSLYVNGARLGQTRLPNLANWEMWDFKTEVVLLNAGDNTIVYQYDAGDSGDVLLDAIMLAPAIESKPTPINTAQAPANTGSTTGTSIWTATLLAALVVVVAVAMVLRWRLRSARKQ